MVKTFITRFIVSTVFFFTVECIYKTRNTTSDAFIGLKSWVKILCGSGGRVCSDSLLHRVLDLSGDLFPPDNPRLDDEEDGAQEVEEGADEGEAE